ncbi:hypothetical protein Leryth_007082 [Lithospermum erythrorhizon]|nr:hypothetical protein Leryth_007082 [Lithospermum erythrorhizon]
MVAIEVLENKQLSENHVAFNSDTTTSKADWIVKATEMMVFSKPMMSEEGEKLGLIDVIVPSKDLLNVARKWA